MNQDERTAYQIAASLELLGFTPEHIKDLPINVALSCICCGIEDLIAEVTRLKRLVNVNSLFPEPDHDS